jgi:hypothetical protein
MKLMRRKSAQTAAIENPKKAAVQRGRQWHRGRYMICIPVDGTHLCNAPSTKVFLSPRDATPASIRDAGAACARSYDGSGQEADRSHSDPARDWKGLRYHV